MASLISLADTNILSNYNHFEIIELIDTLIYTIGILSFIVLSVVYIYRSTMTIEEEPVLHSKEMGRVIVVPHVPVSGS